KEKAVRLLQFLTYSERPLTLEEAVDTIAFRPDAPSQFDLKYRLPYPRDIVKFCSSLVTLVTRKVVGKTVVEVELAHFSVKEYLISEKAPGSFHYKFAEPHSRGCITRSCLAYLGCLGDRKLVADITSQFPLARYSAEYWMDHAKPAETCDDVAKSIMDFFEGPTAYKVWGSLFNPDYPWDKNPTPGRASPLYVASLKGLIVAVQSLLEKGAEVNAQGGNLGNALQAASFRGHQDIVTLLLDKGADVNAQGGNLGNALYAVSSKGHQDIVKLLLDKGADVNAQGGFYGNALQAASEGGHQDIVKLLLDKGADVNAQGGEYDNALYAASEGGHQDIVKLLLDKGADVNALGGEYDNALYAASEGGHQDIVKLLLDKGADGGEYDNALQAASEGGHQDIVKLLLDKGADVN
ncbi:Pfs NACHT and ankyrin domain protein, partial [Triangularia setosa]